jgi:hypothetical protein
MRTYMMPDLSLKTVITFDLPPSGIATAEPDAVGTPPRKRGFCRCSCGFPCATDKDCGGASCDPFISCCERDPQNPDSGWFARELTQASHKRPIPAALLKANCK